MSLFLKKSFVCFHTIIFHVKCLLGLINCESGILFEYHFSFCVNFMLKNFNYVVCF